MLGYIYRLAVAARRLCQGAGVLSAGAGLIIGAMTMASHGAAERTSLRALKNWAYQLQELDFAQASAIDTDMIVIDSSRDGSREGAYSAHEIDRLKRKPDGSRRLVISYFSIGEAEDYRGYWQPQWSVSPPQWLGEENPNWPGNYPVAYWNEGWQQTMLDQLDRIMAAGFDGVYLDRVDVFYEFQQEPDADQKMIDFVARLARHARELDPSFVVIGQNAESLLQHQRYTQIIDGLGKEDLLYGIEGDEIRNSDDQIYWSNLYLDQGVASGVPVFVIEYLDDPELKRRAADEIQALGHVVTCSVRALDELSNDCRGR